MKVHSRFEFWWKQNKSSLKQHEAWSIWVNDLTEGDKESWDKYFNAYVEAGKPDVPMSFADLQKVNTIYFDYLSKEKFKQIKEKNSKKRMLNV